MRDLANQPIAELVQPLNPVNTREKIHKRKWQQQYQELKTYYKTYGNAHVSACKDRAYAKLGRWVKAQRREYREGTLSQERVELLNQLNFQWNYFDVKWQEKYQILRDYYDKHGHSNVSMTDETYRALAQWVHHQRVEYKRGNLAKERIRRLNELNFIWDAHELKWQQNYQALKDYYLKYGHSHVSVLDKEFKELGSWVVNQRQFYKRGQLTKKRIRLLNELHVAWDAHDLKWQERYRELKTYYETYGHTAVSANKEPYKTLGSWVFHQRANYRAGILSQERIDLLNELKFEW